MTLRLGGNGAITGCTSLENPDLTVSGLTISGSFDAEKVLVASGTAAAPSYTFSGDTDNGLYYVGTNSIGLATAGENAISIDADRRVSIGGTDIIHVHPALTINTDTAGGLLIAGGASSEVGIHFRDSGGGDGGKVVYHPTNNYLSFYTFFNERMRIDSSGRLLVGTSSSPSVGNGQYALAVIEGNTFSNADAGILNLQAGAAPASVGTNIGFLKFTANDGSEFAQIFCQKDGTTGSGDYPGSLVFSTTADGASSPTERMRITSSGLIQGQQNSKFLMQFSNGLSTRVPIIELQSSSTSSGAAQNYIVADIAATHGGAFVNPNVSIRVASGSYGASGMVDRLICNAAGVAVNGSFSKTSGSFRIDHPLESKSATHDLVHSFIEGPQADNIYRGQVNLINGTASINLDDAADMTEGTFVLLNTNLSCFTSNETDWTAVRGAVFENILTIEAQDNTSTATVSWLVIGERHDQHMLDTNWTDENGRVITEPLKDIATLENT